jgi:acetyl esterase/lipase
MDAAATRYRKLCNDEFMKTPAELVTPPVVYRLPGMDAVKVIPNLTYSDSENPHLLMDVYAPADLSAGERRPVVMLIHGGGAPAYRPKDWGIFQSWGRLIAASEMIGVTFTHRLGYPEPFLAEASADVRNAMSFVRANAESWNADGDRIGLVAFSAGGPLLGVPIGEKLPCVRCLLAFYAFIDMQPPAVPMFIARAGCDAVPGLNEAMDRFIAAALRANTPVTVVNHPAGEHGFDNQNDDDRSREIIRAALEFMKIHLQR